MLFLLCSWVALAQMPTGDPIQSLLKASGEAESAGRYAEAAARRADARDLLQRVSPEAPQFERWVGDVALVYAGAGRAAEGRAVVEEALARASGRTAIALMDRLSKYREQSGNLLKAIEYAEKALAGSEAQGSADADRYQRLVRLYVAAGRKEDAAAVVARAPHGVSLGSMYEELGRTEEAAAAYREEASGATDGCARSSILQELARLFEGHRRYAEAASAWEQSTGAGGCGETAWMQGAAGRNWEAAGNLERAAQAYRASAEGGSPNEYAAFLDRHQRTEEAESVLNGYLAGHPDLSPWQELQILASVSRDAQQAYRERIAQVMEALGPEPPPTVLQQAQSAVQHGEYAQAVGLTRRAIVALTRPGSPETAANVAMEIATSLADRGQGQLADEIYADLAAAAEGWSVDTMGPLLAVLRLRADSLISHQRWGDAEAVVEQYRAAELAAAGPDSEGALEALRLRIRMDRDRQLWGPAIEARDLVAAEEALNGNRSQEYARALVTAASGLAEACRVDEAERLAAEAAAIEPNHTEKLNLIRRMKARKPVTGVRACGGSGL
jgi:hypothetical protein